MKEIVKLEAYNIEQLVNLSGVKDENLEVLEDHFQVEISLRGDEMSIVGIQQQIENSKNPNKTDNKQINNQKISVNQEAPISEPEQKEVSKVIRKKVVRKSNNTMSHQNSDSNQRPEVKPHNVIRPSTENQQKTIPDINLFEDQTPTNTKTRKRVVRIVLKK